jgi:hypothetical protein
MLSRDELPGRELEDGVFTIDDDHMPSFHASSAFSPSAGTSPPLSATSSPPQRPTAASMNSPHHAQGAPTTSDVKVQVSPRVVPEPTLAGGLPMDEGALVLSLSLSTSPLNLDAPIEANAPPSATDFPSIPSFASSGTHGVGGAALTPPGSSRPLSAWGSAPVAAGSPRPSAWNTPLRTPPSSSPPVVRVHASPMRSGGALHMAPAMLPVAGPSAVQPIGLLSQQREHESQIETDEKGKWERRAAEISAVEDEELRFALELSLAEERSRLGF